MTINIAGMAPMKIGSTVLAIQDLGLPPNMAGTPFRHSGNEFASVMAIPGGKPMARWRSPFQDAYNLLGLKSIIASVFEIYFASFASGLRQSGANHTKYALAASASACCYITGASVAQNGILMADCEAILLAPDKSTHPLAAAASATLPTLSAEPILHTLGPVALGAGPTRIDGVSNAGFANGLNIDVPMNDGDLYPRTANLINGDPSLLIAHDDPIAVLGQLGLTGVSVPTQAIAYFKRYDVTTQMVVGGATAISMAVTQGRLVPSEIQFNLSGKAKTGFTMRPLSSTATHPVAISLTATAP